ncbi:glycerophosphodiester phosphodiesterase [Nocardioides marmoriginsengisoli]|uniref:glycerophosphodiester phosphodiesterase n=1 Tax=Nocardioides marmoriginsengisoli TaxID=661483 RepID=A0A3N0CQ46_9ACTN|nr:glycerophosphodiester phosphodiesterase family protein [Nocardioides marmoriginsengisoli]RNL65459.1 glycerophosphodiester phosphodiesterase [Nocardioides marmoriginsengisoli]
MANRTIRALGAPAVIAHRGASGHRPEHTLAAYELGYRLGANSIELDVVATRDGELVCRHDLELSRTTDVADRPEFAHLRRTLEVEGELLTGWFVHDFTLVELRELRTRERWGRKRQASATYDGRWTIPTLAEVLDLRDQESARTGSRLGVHVELKSPQHLRAEGLWLADLVRDRVGEDLTWLSFDTETLRDLGAARSYRIFDKTPSPKELSRVAEYAVGVAVRRKAVLPRDIGGRVTEPTKLVEKAHKRGLSVLVWTHRAENQHLPTNLRIGSAPHGHGDAAGEAALLFDAGIDGLISDYPEVALAGRNRRPGLPIAR